MIKKQPGGNRPNAGRKKGEPKKAIGIRVLTKYHSQLVKIVRDAEQKLIEVNS